MVNDFQFLLYYVVYATRPQRRRTTEKHLERDLEREMWTAGFRISWRKMKTAAQDRAGWRRVICGL